MLDTGAGYLSMQPDLIRRLGLATGNLEPMNFATRPLKRLRLGDYTQDAVGPVLAIDTGVIEQATDRRVMGLLGYAPLSSFAIRIDYRIDTLALVPMRRDGIAATAPRRMTATDLAAANASLAMARNASREGLEGTLAPDAIGLPFEILGDGKILVRALLGAAKNETDETPLTLVLDTGATKTVLFRRSFEARRGDRRWREMHGLSAPTLYGSENAYMSRVPRITITGGGTSVAAEDVDVAVMDSELERALSDAVHQPVDGLLGYSFLRRFRVTIDYPHRVLWLEPLRVERDQRRFEYSHVGVQIERREGALRVVAVASGSPAAAAGVKPGDEIAGIDGIDAGALDVVGASRRLEGPPGSHVVLRIRQGANPRTLRLTRRELL